MIRPMTFATAAALLSATTLASAQTVASGPTPHADHFQFAGVAAQHFEFLVAEPLDAEAPVLNAPFSADAVNEFTQTLADGNRIERRYSTSLWRDSQGRTRREQQIALVGRLNVDGNPPRLVTINDPVAKVRYTLDERTKTANRGTTSVFVLNDSGASLGSAGTWAAGERTSATVIMRNASDVFVHQSSVAVGAGAGTGVALPQPQVEQLGTRIIEGVEAEGTRTTTVIPAGAIGNVNPIETVSERWFSRELQTAVMITRRDPQSGETVYRLTNISRSEPSPDMFMVPRDYKVVGEAR
jgi:hypothetical protein